MKRKPNPQGSALAMAMILIGVGTFVVMSAFSSLNPFQRFFGDRNKASASKSLVEQGMELGMHDLLERGRASDWTTVLKDEDNPEQMAINVGLVVDLDKQRVIQPRFEKEYSDKSKVRVYYMPIDENADPDGGTARYNVLYPKYFHVISESEEAGTGELNTLEAYVEVDLKSTAEFALAFIENYKDGLLSGDDTSGGATYALSPMEISGRSHLGKIHQDNLYFGATFYHPSAPSAPSSVYFFNGLSSIEAALGTMGPSTFAKDPASSLDFGELVDEFPVELSYEDWAKTLEWLNDLDDSPVIDLGTGEVCLEFEENGVREWGCNLSSEDPKERYKTAGTLYPTGSSGTYFWCDCQLHIKGEINGVVGVYSKQNIIFEGDVQYKDQSANSGDFFSALSTESFIVPVGVPNSRHPFFTTNSFNPPTNVEVSNDRDTGDNGYINLDNSAGTVGAVNAIASLDLDGAYFTFESLQLEPELESGDKIKSINAQMFDWTFGSSPSDYYEWSGTSWQHQEDPAICKDSGVAPDACAVGDELQRNYSDAIWVYGSFVTERPFVLHNSGMGFGRLVVQSDPRFETMDPWGIPNVGEPKVRVLSKKSINGRSELLE